MYLLIDDADNTNVVKDTLYQNFRRAIRIFII